MQEKSEEKNKALKKEDVTVKKLSKASKNTINVTRRRREDLLTVQKKNQFVKVLEETGDLRVAAASVGISMGIINKMVSQDIRFSEAVAKASALYLGKLEKAARTRAIDGVEEAVYHMGEVVGQKTVYDSVLLKTLLKAADKDKYGDKKTIDNTTNINVNDTTSRNKLAGLLGVKLEEVKTIEDDIDGDWEEA